MKVAIISDLHDRLEYLEKCIQYCHGNSIEAILCCGDITKNESVESLQGFHLPIYFIRGNADLFDDEIINALEHIHYLGRTGEVIFDDKKIGLCHEPFFITDLLPQGYDIIFYGHTHKPWLEKKEETYVVNPGTLGGLSAPSTFAVWDTKKPLPELIQTDLQ